MRGQRALLFPVNARRVINFGDSVDNRMGRAVRNFRNETMNPSSVPIRTGTAALLSSLLLFLAVSPSLDSQVARATAMAASDLDLPAHVPGREVEFQEETPIEIAVLGAEFYEGDGFVFVASGTT